ncbi:MULTISPECIES: DUF983 domain-containing protein [unclassified Imperialibacter]|uniref:DUF983 domain-containing protein n=1 Tax=unclassified Imperialibacter TaxID=2629706 RepID=UPI001D0153DB|nr:MULTISPECIES: DUF983 domain-containing protein [unclassified Imperialibacter]
MSIYLERHPMSNKGSKFYAITKMKCPRCHEGDLFPGSNHFSFSKFTHMYKVCSICNQSFEPEPGYYYGAMFVSYGINSVIFVAVWVILALIVDEVTLTMMMVAIVTIVVGLLPFNYRFSRSIWINMMIKYKGIAAKKE